MNIFRLVADLMHLASIFILLLKIKKTRSCVGKSVRMVNAFLHVPLPWLGRTIGISFKTQLLYSLVFLTRYLDLFFRFISVYNTCMKIFFIASSLYILYLMKIKFKATYDANLDTFRIEYLLGAAAILAIAFPYDYSVLEVSERKEKRYDVGRLVGSNCVARSFGRSLSG